MLILYRSLRAMALKALDQRLANTPPPTSHSANVTSVPPRPPSSGSRVEAAAATGDSSSPPLKNSVGDVDLGEGKSDVR